MRKRMMFFAFAGLFGVLAMVFASPVMAAGEPGKNFGMGVSAGFAMFSDDHVKEGIPVGLNLFYYVSENVRLELRGAFISSDVENNPEGLNQGKLTMIPLQLSLHYAFKLGDRFCPYLSGGLGYYLNDFSLEGESQWQELGFDIDDQVDSVIGFHFGLGLDYFFKPNLAANVDIKYCIVSLAGTYSITDTITGISNSGDIDGDLSPFIVEAGVRFLF
jgi:outer membrane protein W